MGTNRFRVTAHRLGLSLAAITLAGGGLFGCGNSTSAGTPGAAGGVSSGAGTGSGGAAGSGQGGLGNAVAGSSGSSHAGNGSVGGTAATNQPDPTTETGACVFYVQRYCEKVAACQGKDASACLLGTDECPDMFYSEGSTRTVESVVACAKDWTAFSCAKLGLGEQPACVRPGSKAVGEPCLYPSQCSSLSCDRQAGDGDCGACQAVVGPDASCTSSSACPGVTTCNLDTGKCQPYVHSLLAEGEACVEGSTCQPGLYCNAAQQCAHYPALGEPCGRGLFCDAAAKQFCAADVTCRARPTAGMPCAKEWDQVLVCELDTSICDPDASGGPTCASAAVAGQPCRPGHQCAAQHVCIGADAEVGVCRLLQDKGGACATVLECKRGLTCDQGICKNTALPELPCNDGSTLCHQDSKCDGQVCVPLASRGTFAAACPK
jgi:hypothetical protein